MTTLFPLWLVREDSAEIVAVEASGIRGKTVKVVAPESARLLDLSTGWAVFWSVGAAEEFVVERLRVRCRLLGESLGASERALAELLGGAS